MSLRSAILASNGRTAVRALATWSVFGTLGGGGSIHQYPVRCSMYAGRRPYALIHASCWLGLVRDAAHAYSRTAVYL
eukprot:3377926-Prymnesium_polylepis.1